MGKESRYAQSEVRRMGETSTFISNVTSKLFHFIILRLFAKNLSVFTQIRNSPAGHKFVSTWHITGAHDFF